MRKIKYAVAALVLAGTIAPASAGVVVLARNVDLTNSPLTFGVTSNDTFTLTYDPQGSFDPDPILVRTTGTAETTSFGGFLGIPLVPSVFFTNPGVEIGPSTFPGFNPFPMDTRAPSTITLSDLGLRYSVGADDFYGYARFAGPDLLVVAFQDIANTAILAGTKAVPEPSTVAMLMTALLGIFFITRRRNSASV